MSNITLDLETQVKQTTNIKKNKAAQSVKIITVSQCENQSDDMSTFIEPNSNRNLLQKMWIYIKGDIYAKDDPYQYTQSKKNAIIFIAAFSGISGTLGNLIYMPDILKISTDLNASLAATNSSIAVYIVFMGVAPLFWASMSDMYGRKPAYIFSLALSVIASIICAVSNNIIMLIVFRAIQACGTSSGQTLGAGVIADTIQPNQRGKAYGIFYTGPLLGQTLGSTIGGLICQYIGWKSTFYFQAILGSILLFMVTFFLPETVRKRPPVFDDKQVESEKNNIFKSFGKAFIPMLLMLSDPTVVLITLYNTIIYACSYLLTPTIADTMQTLYGFKSSGIGFCYSACGFGLVIGSILTGQYSDLVAKRLFKKKGKENVYPEMMLRALFPSFVLLPAGYFIYGWTARQDIVFYVPLVGLFVYSVGQMCAFTPTSLYLVDSKPGKSASAIAINNCVRSIVAAITTIFSISCSRAVGTAIMCTILAAINIANIGIILLVLVYGKKWRTKYEGQTNSVVTESELRSSIPSFI